MQGEGGIHVHPQRWGPGDGKDNGGLRHLASDLEGGLASNLFWGKVGRAREREAVSRSPASDQGRERRLAYGTGIEPVGKREGRREKERERGSVSFFFFLIDINNGIFVFLGVFSFKKHKMCSHMTLS